MKRFLICFMTLAMMGSLSTIAQEHKYNPSKVERETKQKISLIGLDSLLRNYRSVSNEITVDFLMRFSDEQCKKFKNDHGFMVKVADLFMTSMGNEIYSDQRYAAIKKMYPDSIETYLKEANLFFQYAWRDYPQYNPDYLQKAYAQMDTAKVLFPNSTEPYMRWAYAFWR